ncbi:MAG: hypothetical protein JWP91_3039 [Fibrobacteres bacterium]|nr:hypothetical protein [Fibrobacterota bacterium]
MKTIFQRFRCPPLPGLACLSICAILLLACQKKESGSRGGLSRPEPTGQGFLVAKDSNKINLLVDSNLIGLFDSIGPALPGDLNGDGVFDTSFAVHAVSAAKVAGAPISKVTIDTTSPYEDLCGGWGLFTLLSRKDQGPVRWERIYFCGQQSRIQEFGWVGSERLDTLPYPDLKAKAGAHVSHVISLFSQAGIPVYLFWDGNSFKIHEPDEAP